MSSLSKINNDKQVEVINHLLIISGLIHQNENIEIMCCG